jgi:flagellar operon protein
MTDRINGNNGIPNIIRGGAVRPVQPKVANSNFAGILQNKLENTGAVKFSKHAEQRLQTRNINLTQLQKDKINSAVSKAEEKGVKDSLVIMDNLAFVVNIPSKTVITAVNSNEMKENVFTNIDGAVFA